MCAGASRDGGSREGLRAGARAAVVLAVAAATATCASLPERPAAPPAPAPPAAALLRAGDGAGLRVPELEARPLPAPPRPWIRPEVRLSPGEPRAGDAAAVTVSPRCFARRPEAVRGTFGEQEVSFGELGGRWFGMVALPPGEAGGGELALRYRLGPDSTVGDAVRLRVRDRSYPTRRLSVAPRYATPPPEVRERIERERRLVADLLARRTPRWLLTDDVRWPRPARISSTFGVRRTFNDRVRSRHWGVDLRGRTGDPVRAAARGRVALVRDLYFAGSAIYVDHGHGVFTGYFHLSRARAREGQTVRPGEVIGEVGSSGRVTGPHLHWSLYVNGVHVDARSLFSLEIPSARGDGAAAGPSGRKRGRGPEGREPAGGTEGAAGGVSPGGGRPSGRTACSLPGLDPRSTLPRPEGAGPSPRSAAPPRLFFTP